VSAERESATTIPLLGLLFLYFFNLPPNPHQETNPTISLQCDTLRTSIPFPLTPFSSTIDALQEDFPFYTLLLFPVALVVFVPSYEFPEASVFSFPSAFSTEVLRKPFRTFQFPLLGDPCPDDSVFRIPTIFLTSTPFLSTEDFSAAIDSPASPIVVRVVYTRSLPLRCL